MKKILAILVLGCVVIAFANQVEGVYGKTQTTKAIQVNSESMDLINGPVYRPTRAPINDANLANPDDPTSYQTNPFPIQAPESRKPESPFGWADWGNDLLVYDGSVGDGQDMDEDPLTEDIYVAISTDHTTMDSVAILRSTDTGNTWSVFMVGTNTDGEIENPKVRILEAGGQTWVAMLGIWVETTGARNLYMRRRLASGGTQTWEQVDDSVLVADMDADVGSGAWLYCTYEREGSSYNSIYAARNAMAGAGWQDITNLFDDPEVQPYPEIAAGANGQVAVAFIDDRITTDMQVRTKRSTNNGSTWLSSQQVSNTARPLSYTDIAYSHGATVTGWIFVTYDVSGSGQGDNLGFYYTQDNGASYTYGGLVGYTTDDENMGTLRARKISGAATLAYNQDVGGSGDSTMFSWATVSDPTNFTTPVRINDHSATGYWPPTAGWITSGGGYSAITYTSWTQSYNCYLDWFGNPGIEEVISERATSIINLTPNPSQNSAELSYAVANNGYVNISVYDATGRIVQTLVNENKPAGQYSLGINNKNLAAGIYFIKLETPEGITGKTMTIIR